MLISIYECSCSCNHHHLFKIELHIFFPRRTIIKGSNFGINFHILSSRIKVDIQDETSRRRTFLTYTYLKIGRFILDSKLIMIGKFQCMNSPLFRVTLVSSSQTSRIQCNLMMYATARINCRGSIQVQITLVFEKKLLNQISDPVFESAQRT